MDPVLERLRAELAGRYEVEQELGRGGMAVVYLAKDLRHERRVAIKVLRSDLGSSGGDRFLREIRTVAQLNHPHIVALHDSGSVDGHLFYVMPYVEGETLRENLEREGPLSVDEAVRIAREVADALDFAHGRGIVHRDIKPENIFLSAGHALVADFGIARAADAAKQGDTTLTDAGLAVGTPAYMSPEQATADPRIDGRSDQYALGCVLYEMLAGQPPFTGPTSQAVMARHMADPVPPLRTVRTMPAHLESTIVRALAKIPADRWSTTREFSERLAVASPGHEGSDTHPISRRRVVTAVVAATLIMIVAFSAKFLGDATQSNGATDLTDSVRSVVIAPFSFQESSSALFADGITEGLLNGLIRVPGLSFPGAGNPRLLASRGQQDEQVSIAREIGANVLITGEIEVQGRNLRVRPKVIDVATGAFAWQEKFYGELGEDETLDLFSMQDAMAERIVAALLPRLRPEQRAVVTRGVRTNDLEAYELYLRGKAAADLVSAQGSEEARRLFEEAIQRDSSFADAWSGLAGALDQLLQFSGRSPAELISRLNHAVERASGLDSLHPGIMVLRARTRLYFQFDYDGYDREMKRALSLYPNHAFLHLVYGQDMFLFGEGDSALAEAQRAARLDSTHAFIVANLADGFVAFRRKEEAMPIIERSLALDANGWLPRLDHAVIAANEGRHGDAARSIDEARRLLDDSPWILSYVVQCSRIGAPASAQAAMRKLEELSRKQYVQHVLLAHAKLALGDRKAALTELEASSQMRDRDFLPKVGWGEFEALKGEPRYEAVLRGTGLPWVSRGPQARPSYIVGC